ncbi:MAG: hypothetical protein LLG14_02785 [Nocardiaceae bacterium]|nr:hypothetical protein [Nocardiaceae bacterium]
MGLKKFFSKFRSRTEDALHSSAEAPSLEPIPKQETLQEKHPPDRPLD